MPVKSTVYYCVRKLEKTGTSQDEPGRLRQQMADTATVDLCQVRAVSQKIFAKIVPSTLLILAYLSKSYQKKQSFDHTEWPRFASCWNKTSRNNFATANGCRTSFTIRQDCLTSRSLRIKPGSICMVRWIHRILGYELPKILKLFAKNYDIRK